MKVYTNLFIVISVSNVKSFFEGLYRGYIWIMTKFNIRPNYTNKIKGKIIINYEVLDPIECRDIHKQVSKDCNFRNLASELSTINKHNYKRKPSSIIQQLQKIAFPKPIIVIIYQIMSILSMLK